MSAKRPDNPGAYVSPDAVIHRSAAVHAGAWVGEGVEVGPGAVIAPGAVVGFPFRNGWRDPVRIEAGVRVGPNVTIEPGVVLGRECRIGASSCLRAGTRIGALAAVGERCVIMGNCLIGEHAMLHADVHVCERAELRAHCQIMPGAALLNDPYPPTALDVRGPVIGECAVLGVKSVIWPGVAVGYHAIVATYSEVKHDVADYMLVRGRPAKPICDVRKIRMRLGDRWVYPYPWMRHNMPGEDITHPAL